MYDAIGAEENRKKIVSNEFPIPHLYSIQKHKSHVSLPKAECGVGKIVCVYFKRFFFLLSFLLLKNFIADKRKEKNVHEKNFF